MMKLLERMETTLLFGREEIPSTLTIADHPSFRLGALAALTLPSLNNPYDEGTYAAYLYYTGYRGQRNYDKYKSEKLEADLWI
tara:strand:- start:1475 stop:1723 length:249 start_codon:yes stop_codon:yes gene_type:complete